MEIEGKLCTECYGNARPAEKGGRAGFAEVRKEASRPMIEEEDWVASPKHSACGEPWNTWATEHA